MGAALTAEQACGLGRNGGNPENIFRSNEMPDLNDLHPRLWTDDLFPSSTARKLDEGSDIGAPAAQEALRSEQMPDDHIMNTSEVLAAFATYDNFESRGVMQGPMQPAEVLQKSGMHSQSPRREIDRPARCDVSASEAPCAVASSIPLVKMDRRCPSVPRSIDSPVPMHELNAKVAEVFEAIVEPVTATGRQNKPACTNTTRFAGLPSPCRARPGLPSPRSTRPTMDGTSRLEHVPSPWRMRERSPSMVPPTGPPIIYGPRSAATLIWR